MIWGYIKNVVADIEIDINLKELIDLELDASFLARHCDKIH